MLYTDPFLTLPFQDKVAMPTMKAPVPKAGKPKVTAPPTADAKTAGILNPMTWGGRAGATVGAAGRGAETARLEGRYTDPQSVHRNMNGVEGAKVLANPLHSAASNLTPWNGAAVGALGGIAADMVDPNKDDSTVGHILGGAALGAGAGHFIGGAARKSLDTTGGSLVARHQALSQDLTHANSYAPHLAGPIEAEVARNKAELAGHLGTNGGAVSRFNTKFNLDPARAAAPAQPGAGIAAAALP